MSREKPGMYRLEIRRRMMLARRMKARRLPKWRKYFWIASYLLARAGYACQAGLNRAACEYCRYAEHYISRLIGIMRTLDEEDIYMEEAYSTLVDDLAAVRNINPEWLVEKMETRIKRAIFRHCPHPDFPRWCRVRTIVC